LSQCLARIAKDRRRSPVDISRELGRFPLSSPVRGCHDPTCPEPSCDIFQASPVRILLSSLSAIVLKRIRILPRSGLSRCIFGMIPIACLTGLSDWRGLLRADTLSCRPDPRYRSPETRSFPPDPLSRPALPIALPNISVCLIRATESPRHAALPASSARCPAGLFGTIAT
jgi:hypothetical protein